MRTTFFNARVITPETIISGGVVIEDDRIVNVFRGDGYEKEGTLKDCGGKYIAPGFVDIHNHGTADGLFFTSDPDEMERAAMLMARHGTTSVVPTSCSAAHDDVLSFLKTVKSVMGKNRGSKLPGAHLEGNYFNPEFAGAQNPEFLYSPREEEYMELIDTGIVLRVSASPELPGACEMARKLSSMGILISMAHTGANYEEVRAAIDSGFTHMTHIYNAASFLSNCYFYPQIGACEASLLHDEITIEAICDGRHVPASLLKLMYKIKGADHMHAVTDAAIAGAGPGPLTFWGMDCLVEDDVCMLADRSAFAGSVTTQDKELKVLVQDADIPLTDAVKMLSLTPAKVIGLTGIGRIAPGYAADLNVLDEKLDVIETYIDGKLF